MSKIFITYKITLIFSVNSGLLLNISKYHSVSWKISWNIIINSITTTWIIAVKSLISVLYLTLSTLSLNHILIIRKSRIFRVINTLKLWFNSFGRTKLEYDSLLEPKLQSLNKYNGKGSEKFLNTWIGFSVLKKKLRSDCFTEWIWHGVVS